MSHATLTEEYAEKFAREFAVTFNVPFEHVFKVARNLQARAKEKECHLSMGGLIETILLTENRQLIQTQVTANFYRVANGKTSTAYKGWVVVYERDD